MGLVPAACDRVGATTGGAAHDVRRDRRVSLCRGGLAPTARLTRSVRWSWCRLVAAAGSGGGCRFAPCSAAVGGDGGVPPLAGGDHGMQVPQNRRGDDGLGLGGP